MHKNKNRLFILIFSSIFAVFFLVITITPVLAAENLTDAQCAAVRTGASCKQADGAITGCTTTEESVGLCTDGSGGGLDWRTCCAPKPTASAGGLKYTLLEKIPGLASTDGSNLPVYVKAIYSTALAVVVLCALFMLSVGGFMYLTSAGNTSAMGTAKEVIFDSIIGLIIALSAWLLLNVINPDLVNVTISGLSARPTLPGAPAPVTPVPPAGQYSNADAVAALQVAGISVTSSGNCSNQNNASCTSLESIPQSTIANIVNLKTISGCGFNVTGGTEVGHASHGSGKPIVDVSEAPCLRTFFQTSKGQGTLTSSAHITAICATAANQSVAFNCSYQEPAAHFHLQFNP